MTTLTVNQSFDFSNALLSNITLLDFTNRAIAGVPATATFAASQFETGQLVDALAVDGSNGVNNIVVNGGNLIASSWTFSNWSSNDSITINGSAGQDSLFGSSQNDTINGGSGDDILVGGGGANQLNGDLGNDKLFSDGPDAINGGGGTDFASLDRQGQNAALNVSISAGGGGLDIGDGTRLTSIERLQMFSGSGNDTITGGAFADELHGGGGNDLVNGQGGGDILVAGAGTDTLSGGGGGDELLSFNSQDAAGVCIADGGSGSDLLVLKRLALAVSLNVDIGDGGGGRDIGDGSTLTSIETLQFEGGSGDDVAKGGRLADNLVGRHGNDTLLGRGGNDHFFMTSDDGADSIDGGGGIDGVTLHYAETSLDIHVINISDGGAGRDIGDGTTLIRVEQIDFQGGRASDTVTGGGQVDHLEGFGGNDVLKGGGGDDKITGNLGQDTLTGDAGADSFIYTDIAESVRGAQRDKITDFVTGTDLIDLSSIGQPIDFIGTAAFGHHAGELRFASSATQTIISWDTDGNGIADFQIALTGVIALTAADFVL